MTTITEKLKKALTIDNLFNEYYIKKENLIDNNTREKKCCNHNKYFFC